MKLKPEIEKLIQEKLSNCDAGTCSECDERADLARAGFLLGVEKAADKTRYVDRLGWGASCSTVVDEALDEAADLIRALASEHPDAGAGDE